MTTLAMLLASLTLLLVLGFAARAAWRRRDAPVASGSSSATSMAAPAKPATVEPPCDAVANAEVPHNHRDKPLSPPLQPREILHRLYAVAFDDARVAEAGMASRAGHAEVVAAAVSILARIETQPRYIPRRPQLLPQLMRAVNDTDVSLRTMAGIISQDPALAGNLLRITNSPLYRVQARPIESIERAVTVVGTEGIRLIIAAALVQPVMSVNGSVFGRFPTLIWEHTLLSAAAAADHAKFVEQGDPFAAQLLGLLQGLGSIIVVQVVRDQYARQPDLTPEASVAAALLDAWAGPTARRIAASWGLSDHTAAALDEWHDDVPGELGTLGRSLRYGRVAGALAVLCGRGSIDEAMALAALASLDDRAHATPGIWARIRASQDQS